GAGGPGVRRPPAGGGVGSRPARARQIRAGLRERSPPRRHSGPDRGARGAKAGVVTLDRTDAVALARLMEEGRVSWAELAKALRLSPAAAAQRVRRLEKA